jgi:hypothetical protein
MSEAAGLNCPRCGRLAVFLIGDRQAFCGNDDCSILMWDPSKTAAENEADMQVIDLRGGANG